MRKGAVRRLFLCRLDDGYTISSEVKVKIIACIEDPAVIEKFLKHLKLVGPDRQKLLGIWIGQRRLATNQVKNH
jgi:hypothetical protein